MLVLTTSGGGVSEVFHIAFNLLELVNNSVILVGIENEVVWYSRLYTEVRGSRKGR